MLVQTMLYMAYKNFNFKHFAFEVTLEREIYMVQHVQLDPIFSIKVYSNWAMFF